MGRLEIKPPIITLLRILLIPLKSSNYSSEEFERNIYTRFLPRTISVIPAAIRSASWSPTDS